MQNQLILPSKRRIDIHGILVPFDQLLLPGEVLVEGTCTVKVLTGVDPDPAHMLEGGVQVRGTNLYQQIKLGVPGVIYSVTFEGITDLENTYTVETKQAVLVDEIPAGPIYQPFYFTSPPYPLQLIDDLDTAADISNAQFIAIPLDGIDAVPALLSGNLRDFIKQYSWGPEGIDAVSSELLSGTLRLLVIQYSYLEGMDSASELRSGNLREMVIIYSNYPPEGIDSTSSLLSGTLI